MTVTSDTHPSIGRPGVVSAFVSTIKTGDHAAQRRAAAAVADHWRRSAWPAGLAAVSCFGNLDGGAVLVYEQWTDSSAAGASDRTSPQYPVTQGPPVEYRLYRTVPGAGVADPPPPAGCFPVAFFAVEPGESGREKIDTMLAAEEEKAGSRREYPGGIAAHMHVSADGTSVFVLSEWVSADLYAAHIENVWKQLLADGGHQALEENTPATGDRYRHYATVTASDR